MVSAGLDGVASKMPRLKGPPFSRWLLSWTFFLLSWSLKDAEAQSVRLAVDPPFEYVSEDWPVGRALPDLSICSSGARGRRLRLAMSSGNELGFFKIQEINSTCWTLLLQKELNADQINSDGSRGQTFSVALRARAGNMQAFGSVDIQVVDINDNPPQFVNTDSSVSVSENTRPGSEIATVTTTDPDTGVGGINGFRLADDFDRSFEVRKKSCEDTLCRAGIFLLQPLSYDKKNLYSLEIIASDGAGRIDRVNEATFKLAINVVDVQNKPPRFVTDNRIHYVPEDTAVGTEVFRMVAIDGDGGVTSPNRIFYKIVSPSPYFGINSTTGWVFLEAEVDREKPEILEKNGAINLEIQAEEGTLSLPRPSSKVNVTVLITDVDDSSPACNRSSYLASVLENSQPLIPLTFLDAPQLYVFDKDAGGNGEFGVSLAGNDAQYFDVSPKVVYQEANLIIRVRDPKGLDFETKKELTDLKVVLSPNTLNGNQPGSCDVTVRIMDANDNAPTFNQTSFNGSVAENKPPATFVTKIGAYDSDTTKFRFILFTLAGAGAEKFSIDRDGNVKTAVKLDREETSEYHLTVVATDDEGKGNRETAPLHIKVLDENDQPPKFTKPVYEAFLQENSLYFTQLNDGLFVKAEDADEAGTRNANLSYWIIASSYGAENFSLNPFSGLIKPQPPGVDREGMAKDFFNLSIIAQDQGKDKKFTATANVIIYVNDTNDNSPIFERALYNASVLENSTFGTFIVKVAAHDEDRSAYNSRIAYRILDVQDKFVVDSTSGVLSVAKGATLDIAVTGKEEYMLTVAALDQGFPQRSGETKVAVTVRDINDKPPSFPQKIYEVSVFEHAPPFTSLLKLVATDPDPRPRLSYRIAEFMDALDENSRPVSRESYDYSGLFGIKGETGELYTAKQLDREQLQHVALVVDVEDLNAAENKPQIGRAVIDITIMDANDNAPVFSVPFYSKSVQENVERGSIIMSLSATDPDSNRTLHYSIKPYPHPLVDVNRDTGELTVVGPIDYEALDWINFTAVATDLGSPPKTSSVPVTLKIIDQNDNSPVFHPSSTVALKISEDAPVGSPLVKVNATDLDSGSYGQVSFFLLTELTGGTPSFVVNETTGVVTVNKPLDRESRSSYTLTVKAVDDYTGHLNPDSHEATAIIEVEILDVNDNPPTFSPSTPASLSLAENNKAGLQVATITALDLDDSSLGNGRIRYFLTGGNATLPAPIVSDRSVTIPMFSLEPQSGALTLSGNLKGRFGTYFLVIEAVDLGEPPLKSNMTIQVDVQDYNDHKPVIVEPKPQAEFGVPENNFTDNEAIVQIKALDKDQGVNSELRYSIKKTGTNQDWKFFTTDLITGKIYLKGELDFEKQDRYSLTAQACDSASPPLCDEVEFTIVVQDRDDNCPFFQRTLNYTHEVAAMENRPAGSVVSEILKAIDKDTDPNNTKVCYEILSKSPRNAPLRMEAAGSRKLVATEKLDREKRESYSLLVRATDCHRNTRCGATSGHAGSSVGSDGYDSADKTLLLVKVLVADLNDNPPRFTQRVFEGGIQYDTKIGTRVTRIRATDPDRVDRGSLRYSMAGKVISKLTQGTLSTARAPFFLNSTTGDITTNIIFQPAWKGSFEFAVNVNDSGGFADTAFVRISLLSFDQQVELLFDAPPNKVWDEAHQIIRLLSAVTNSNATIDDVRPSDKIAKADQPPDAHSKVLVHFLGSDQQILPVEEALKALDNPSSSSQSRSKQELISLYGLKYAGHNLEPHGSSDPDYTVYFAFAGVVGALLLILVVLVSVWCCQTHRYRRKLKAATTLAFGSADLTVPSYDVPGTNLHSNSNPVWTGKYGVDNYGIDYDDIASQKSKNSLDENDIRLGANTDSTDGGSSQSDGGRPRRPKPRDSRADLPQAADRSYQMGHNHYSSANTERALSPQSGFPGRILANLESTEL